MMTSLKMTPDFVRIKVQDMASDGDDGDRVSRLEYERILSKFQSSIIYFWTALPLMSPIGVIISTAVYYGLYNKKDHTDGSVARSKCINGYFGQITHDNEITHIAILGLAVICTTVLTLLLFSCGMLRRVKPWTTPVGWLMLIILSAVSDILLQTCLSYVMVTLDPCLKLSFTWTLLIILSTFMFIHLILCVPVWRLIKKVLKVRAQMTTVTISSRRRHNDETEMEEKLEETFYWKSTSSQTVNNVNNNAPIYENLGSKH